MRNLTLLTDFYELTMMYGYFLQGKTEEVATFDLFFRPYEESNFCIAAGLEQAIEYVNNLHFSAEDIGYLRSTKAFNEDFLKFLADFRFTGSIKAIPEGTVVFPYEPLMVITAPICQAQLMEAALLNIINFQTLIATKARRIAYAAAPGGVLEFGLRRKGGGNRRLHLHKQRAVRADVRYASKGYSRPQLGYVFPYRVRRVYGVRPNLSRRLFAACGYVRYFGQRRSQRD